jgi:hypothetical protein
MGVRNRLRSVVRPPTGCGTSYVYAEARRPCAHVFEASASLRWRASPGVSQRQRARPGRRIEHECDHSRATGWRAIDDAHSGIIPRKVFRQHPPAPGSAFGA